jgi:cell wall assembly regulator SMI1
MGAMLDLFRGDPALGAAAISRHARLTEAQLAAHVDRWDWRALSENLNLVWTAALIARFAERWNWEALAENPKLPWSAELLAAHDWNFARLSGNPAIPWTPELLERYAERLDWHKLTQDATLPWSMALIARWEARWDWGKETGAIGDRNFNNRGFPYTAEVIAEFAARFDFAQLSAKPHRSPIAWTEELVERFADRWDWERLSANPDLPWSLAFLEKYEDRWDWGVLSEGANGFKWPADAFARHADRLDLARMCQGQATWGHDNLAWTEALIGRYADRWDWDELSRSPFVPFTAKLVERFEDHWTWKLLSMNPAVPWDGALIARWIDRVDFAMLSGNPRPFWTEALLDKYKTKLKWKAGGKGAYPGAHLRANPSLPWSLALIEKYRPKWGNGFVTRQGHDAEHEKLPWAFELVERNDDPEYAREISCNRGLPWSAEILEKYRARWNWQAIARNHGIAWTAAMLDVFATEVTDRREWDRLLWGPLALPAFQAVIDARFLAALFGGAAPVATAVVHGATRVSDPATVAAWARFTNWLAAHAAPLHGRLKPPAGAEAIARAEDRMGLHLPDALYTLLGASDGGDGAFAGATLMGIARIHEIYDRLRDGADDREDVEVATAVKVAMTANKLWIPFVDFGTGDFLCIDLDPGAAGTRGQIIEYCHDDVHSGPLAIGLAEYLAAIADDMEAGRYRHANGEMTPGLHFDLSSLEGRAQTIVLTKDRPKVTVKHKGKVTFHTLESHGAIVGDKQDKLDKRMLTIAIDGEPVLERRVVELKPDGPRIRTINKKAKAARSLTISLAHADDDYFLRWFDE